MKNNIELEKCRFVGDSSVNEAIYTKDDGTTLKCTQTDFIDALAKSKKYIKSGRKLKTNSNNGKISYLIDYGNKENEPKQMIKVTFDEENLAKGDVNALAVDSVCQHSITVRKNNVKKKVLTGVALTLVCVGLSGTLAYGLEKDSEYQTKKMEDYIEQTNDKRREQGLNPLPYGEQNYSDDQGYVIDENDIIERARQK